MAIFPWKYAHMRTGDRNSGGDAAGATPTPSWRSRAQTRIRSIDRAMDDMMIACDVMTARLCDPHLGGSLMRLALIAARMGDALSAATRAWREISRLLGPSSPQDGASAESASDERDSRGCATCVRNRETHPETYYVSLSTCDDWVAAILEGRGGTGGDA
jgi:hypothetical protein